MSRVDELERELERTAENLRTDFAVVPIPEIGDLLQAVGNALVEIGREFIKQLREKQNESNTR